jgi:hypothetical protein
LGFNLVGAGFEQPGASGFQMKKFCIPIILILLGIIGAGVYKFVFQGNVIPIADGRQGLLLEAAERDLVLAEIRAFRIELPQQD